MCNQLPQEINMSTNSVKDVVFVINTSGSVGSSHFQLMREFTANITADFFHSHPEVHAVRVILIDNTAHVQFHLTAHTNLSTLL